MLEQKNTVLPFLDRLQKLRWIDRCSNTSHIKEYSVAQHSFYVALYGMAFSYIENERLECEYYEIELVLQKALAHDLEESLTGDILFPLHNDYPEFKEKLDFIRNVSVDKFVFDELPESAKMKFKEAWRSAKDDTPSGIMVACMDKFEIVMYCLTEFELGNMGMKQIYNNARRIIEEEFSIPSVNQAVKEIGSVVLSNYTVPTAMY